MEDFVTLEIAKKVKEKRFPQGNENDITEKYYTISDSLKSAIMLANNEDVEWYCPTISQVLKWLREEKNIHICIGYSDNINAMWDYEVILLDGALYQNSDFGYESYEEAVLAGIEYVLDNLI